VDYSVLIMMVTKMVLPEHLKLRLYGPTGSPMMIFENDTTLLVGWKCMRDAGNGFACNYQHIWMIQFCSLAD